MTEPTTPDQSHVPPSDSAMAEDTWTERDRPDDGAGPGAGDPVVEPRQTPDADDSPVPPSDAAAPEVAEPITPELDSAGEVDRPVTLDVGDADVEPDAAEPSAGAADAAADIASQDDAAVAASPPDADEPSAEPAEDTSQPQPPASAPAAPSQPQAAAPPAPQGPGAASTPASPAGPAPSPALLARKLHAAPPSSSTAFGRVAEDGTVFVRTPEGEREVGSYPGASPAEALAYFARKYDEVDAQLDLLLHRVTQTDLAAKEASDALAKSRKAVRDLKAVGDLVALSAKLENVATAVDARRTVENEERAHARDEAKAKREEIVTEAEGIAGQAPERVQWKTSSSRMREILDEWKAAQRQGPRLDRESEQALWHRLSSARNSFDKMRRVHFAQLGSSQAQAKATKEDLVAEAESLAKSNDWGVTAGEFKRLMDRWRQAGRASRSDDDALWQRFKAAQDSFFAAKDAVAAAETEEFRANLAVKEELLVQAQALLPVTDLEATKSALRTIQDKWDAAGKVPRADMDRVEKGMRRVESAVREAEERRWASTNPEVAARAQSLVTQLEAAVEGLKKDLAKAQAGGDAKKVAAAQEALTAREAWLEQARTGLAEFRG